jgi:hypothetical protein
MNLKSIKYLGFFLFSAALTSCDSDVENFRLNQPEPLPPLEAGTADFSTYVALGNSLTAGFTDNALFRAGQENSFPNIAAEKMALIGGGVFTQPLTNDNFGGLALNGTRIADPRLVFGGAGPVPLESVIGPVTVTTDIVLNNPIGPFNNLGIPGAASFHLLAPGYGNVANLENGTANPYAVRVTGNAPNATILELALAQNPTFFSLWIGNNDVLGFATSGGVAPITDQATFDASLGAVVAALSNTASGGVIANIPDVTTIPFLSTVPFDPLDPSNPAFGPQIPTLNAQFAALNAAYAFLGVPERSVVFSETTNSPVVIHDEDLEDISAQLAPVLVGGGLDPLTAGLLASQYGQSRQATAEDDLTLTSSSVIATLNENRFNELLGLGVDPETAGQLSINGVTFPLENQWVLTANEIAEANVAISNFNATIAGLASQFGIALVDANALLTELNTTGIKFDDYNLTSDLVFGGVFSLDGVHLTARGNALAANEFLKAIDDTYGTNFEASGNLAKAGDYPTNFSPTLQ